LKSQSQHTVAFEGALAALGGWIRPHEATTFQVDTMELCADATRQHNWILFQETNMAWKEPDVMVSSIRFTGASVPHM
jgi:hypothetical protein